MRSYTTDLSVRNLLLLPIDVSYIGVVDLF